MEVVLSLVGKLLELSVEPIWNNIGYIFHHKRNVENLRGHLENLEAQRNGIQGSINEARRNGEEIKDDVKLWIKNVDWLKQEAIQFMGDDASNVNKKCFYGWFPDLITRYRLGKKAAKKALEVQQLEGKGNFNIISHRAPPLGIQSMASRNFVAFKTTELAMTNVMEALKDKDIDLIGIHGMGGVGKTTLVKEIGKKAEEEKLFQKVVMAVVSQNVDLKKIQGQIADMLDLHLRSETDTGRANELHKRLEDATLIILDDVWARVNVAEIGIPFPFGDDLKNCKIIITTRREQVCHAMGRSRESTKIICLEVLSEEESWDLFKRNVGDVVDSPTLNVMVQNILKECRGLPLALVTVGRAMRGKNRPEEWIEAAQELKKSSPTNIEGVEKEVYKSLKLSYDYLQDKEAKSCFLLCCLFPEDHVICVEDLVRYGIGLRIFKNIDTIEEARRRVIAVVKNLQDSCLLLSTKPPFLAIYDITCRPGFTKMHDIVRDVAISIASDKYFVRAGVNLEEWPNMEYLEGHSGISLMCNNIRHGVTDWRELPELQILLVQDNESLKLSSSYHFFSRLKSLAVLDLSNTTATSQLPTILRGNCLRTLILERITFQTLDADFIENLKSLEVLSFKYSRFQSPINAIEKLTNIRMLDLTEIHLHHLIPANVISQLSRLEELYFFRPTFNEEKFAPIEVAGLQPLSHLRVLSISLDATQISPSNFSFPDLETFCINIIAECSWRSYVADTNHLSLGNLVQATMLWTKWVKRLFKKTDSLGLFGMEDVKHIIPDLSFDGDNLNGLKILDLSLSVAFEYLINTEEWLIPSQDQHQQVLSNLTELYLSTLHSFKGICRGSLPPISSGLLSKLERLDVSECPNLSNVLLPFDLLQRLQGRLRVLDIRDCKSLELVFDFETEGPVKLGNNAQLLSDLRKLILRILPRLKHLFNCHGQIVQLHNLRVMEVTKCYSFKYLFPHSVAQSLQKLEILVVYNSNELEEIVAKENGGQRHKKEEEKEDKMNVQFASLKTLKLLRLLNLNGFCTGSFPFNWPSLEEVVVHSCPKMATFAAIATTSGIQSMPKLKAIKLDGVEKSLEGEDLNAVMKKHFKPNEILDLSQKTEEAIDREYFTLDLSIFDV